MYSLNLCNLLWMFNNTNTHFKIAVIDKVVVESVWKMQLFKKYSVVSCIV